MFEKFILRDILHYNDEDIRNLSLVDYNLAVYYAVETYVRRDILFIMCKTMGIGKNNKEKGTTLQFSHPEIEEWISQQYEKEANKE